MASSKTEGECSSESKTLWMTCVRDGGGMGLNDSMCTNFKLVERLIKLKKFQSKISLASQTSCLPAPSAREMFVVEGMAP